MKKKKYIDNKKFLAAMIVYKDSIKEWESNERKEKKPLISDYIGECIYKIAVHLAKKSNFSNYTYKDDMVGDGIENCIHYIDKFNPDKFDNPFAYFTTIIYYAFLRRIASEKKQSYIKYKKLEDFEHEQKSSNQHNLGGVQITTTQNKVIREMIDSFEKKHNITGKRGRKKSVKKKSKVIVDKMTDVENTK